ncbi:MAG: mycofactocin biosynthesis glycosyltransferase MftF [Desulfatiglandaceae bacterium]
MSCKSDNSPRRTAYRLPKGVRWSERKGSFQLVLTFPLKAVLLHPSWSRVFRLLSKGKFVSLEQIAGLFKSQDQGKIELFLNDLSRKGFLEQEGFSKLSEYPYVSIIIPVRNRPKEIEACLNSLGKIIYPSEKLEIIVVDDASSDDTPLRISRFPVRLILLKQQRQASYCRNLAAKEARGIILAFIDSDCVADPLWLQELVPVFRDLSVGAVGGLVDSYSSKTPLERYEKVKSPLAVSPRARRSSESDKSFYVPACNLLARRKLFLELGGFKEDLNLGEDVDLSWRMQDSGHQVEFKPAGKVYHRHRNRLSSFCMRRFDYGTSEPLLQKLHPQRSKEMFFPTGAWLFWGSLAFALVFRFFPLLGVGVFIILLDAMRKFLTVRRKRINIVYNALIISTLRTYFAFFYHSCAFVSRYYLIWALAFAPFLPRISVTVFGAHIFTGLGEYMMKKPHLNLVSFLCYFSLDQLSYQLGVWWGCFNNSFFNSVSPRITAKISDSGGKLQKTSR